MPDDVDADLPILTAGRESGEASSGAALTLPAASGVSSGSFGAVDNVSAALECGTAGRSLVEVAQGRSVLGNESSTHCFLPPRLSDTDDDDLLVASLSQHGSRKESTRAGGVKPEASGTRKTSADGTTAGDVGQAEASSARPVLKGRRGTGGGISAMPLGDATIRVAPVEAVGVSGSAADVCDRDDDILEDLHDQDVEDRRHPSVLFLLQTGPGTRYHALYGDMPVEDAMLDLMCQTAALNGKIFGDNMADNLVIAESEVQAMQVAAYELGESIQVLYGTWNTSKLHRLMYHMAEELRTRGKLWEGETSVNEGLHKSCKKMYKRTNRRVPGVALQILRCDETLSKVLQEWEELDSYNHNEGRNMEDGDGVDEGKDAPANGSMAISQPHRSGRGKRFALGELTGRPGLNDVFDALFTTEDEVVVVANTIKIVAKYEWGAHSNYQYVRGAMDFNGKPRFSYVRYESGMGPSRHVRWGLVHLILRRVGRVRRDCVVVQRMQRVTPRARCVLTRYGCK